MSVTNRTNPIGSKTVLPVDKHLPAEGVPLGAWTVCCRHKLVLSRKLSVNKPTVLQGVVHKLVVLTPNVGEAKA